VIARGLVLCALAASACSPAVADPKKNMKNEKEAPKETAHEEAGDEGRGHALPSDLGAAGALPEVRARAGLEQHDFDEVRLVGRYTEVDVRMKATPPPRHDGHVAIVLSDGAYVSLWPVWHAEARRPRAEIEHLRGHLVVVVGEAHARAPEEPHGGASPLGPCVDDVKAIAISR
jgi:hypothetical protein